MATANQLMDLHACLDVEVISHMFTSALGTAVNPANAKVLGNIGRKTEGRGLGHITTPHTGEPTGALPLMELYNKDCVTLADITDVYNKLKVMKGLGQNTNPDNTKLLKNIGKKTEGRGLGRIHTQGTADLSNLPLIIML